MAGPLTRLRTAAARLWPGKALAAGPPTRGEREMAAWTGPYATYPGGWSADKIAAVEANRGWVYKCCSFLSARVGVVPSVVRAGDPGDSTNKALRVSALRKKAYLGYRVRTKGSTGPARPHHDLEHVEDSHPLARLLAAPNRVDTAADFWPYFCTFRYLCGVSYLWKVRDRANPGPGAPGGNDRRGSDRGNVVELWVLPATWITPRAGDRELIERYEVRPWGTRGGMTYLHPDDVIQWGEKSPIHPLAFYGPTQAAAAVIDVYGMLEVIRYNALQNGADPGGVLESPPDAADLSPQALQRLAQRFQGRFGGVYNAGMPLVLPGGWKYVPRSGEQEMAHRESIDQARDYVMAMYDLDKSLMGFIESSTYAGPVVAQNMLKYQVIRPKHLSLAEALTERLAAEFGDDLAIVYDDDDTGITDPQERRADIQQLLTHPAGPAITQNELRAEHGFEVLDDPEADKLYYNPSFVSAEHLDDAVEGNFGGMLGEGDGKPGGGVPRPGVAKALAAVGLNGKAWDESAHPRGRPDNAGQFAPGGRSATLADGRTVTFVPHPKQRDDETTVMVDAKKLDAGFARDGGYYLPPGGVGESEIRGRRAGVAEFLTRGEPVQASRAVVDADGTVSFIDGRHRFAVLRDAGVDRVAVTVPREQAGEFRRRFGAGEAADASGHEHAPAGRPEGGQCFQCDGDGYVEEKKPKKKSGQVDTADAD